MLLLERPWKRQPTAPASVDFGSPFARGLVSCWSSNGTIWFGPQDGTRTPLGIGDGTTVNSFGLASGPFTVIANTQNTGRFPDGSYGTNSSGTFIAAVRYVSSGGNQTIRGGATNEMQLRITSAGALVFVKRAVSARITAGSVVTGEDFVIAGSFGTSNRLYKNGVLLGSDTGNLVNSQAAASWIGHDGGAAEDWLGSVAFVASWDRQLSDDEVAQVSANPWQLFAPRRIWVPVSAGGGSDTLITTGIGAATASGTTAVVNRAQTIATGTGAASAAGVQAVINRAQFVAATIGAATASGTTASVNLARFVATGIGAATAAGTQATITADGSVVITTGIGAATAAGVQARIDLARFIATGIGAAAASGTQATITNAADVVVSTGVGAAVADGAAATFIRNVLVACGVGNATADGTQATVIGEGLEPAETRRRGGGNRFVLARKRLPSAYLIDWLTNEEPSEETKRVIREIKAGRPLPERLDPPKVEKQITPEQLAAKLIPRRLINLSEVLPVEQTQLIRKAVRIAQERDDEDILMLL